MSRRGETSVFAGQVQPPRNLDEVPVIDREKLCPFLLRVFVQPHNHHRPAEFDAGALPTRDELQVYTWQDATLLEIATIIRSVYPAATDRDTRFSLRRVYFEHGRSSYRDLGVVTPGRKGNDDASTLWSTDFHIGDYMDIAVIPPGSQRFRNNAAGNNPGGRPDIDHQRWDDARKEDTRRDNPRRNDDRRNDGRRNKDSSRGGRW
ncbi:hypothetical protein CAOG_00644 [Capsaspora owczarzaki ATCC 30864]|uniref:Histone deacetylase complex subunit SAP18 n=1 Tax=Capsaspora owczarzaki (strain ATCC 30864) TaxID=595528 RepID=A0A0D2U1N9_CAPO3|nr:hypothetical protein CAOG_00644 [Capsaspora owczarzaki ATCC 30864]KJE89096.1 hypothetical protein CAOG_000644 [Capsaspora owczarzaki ATCC 30864]|eukprot:XP_004365515.1 hypothetical protein CAOG_00644 [Capsaspora owczarzaki ATCC 30864]